MSRRMARWVQFLAQFQVTIKYRKGTTNMADPLSRSPGLLNCMLLAVQQSECQSTMASRQRASEARRTHPLGAVTAQVLEERKPRNKAQKSDFLQRILAGYPLDPWFAIPRNLAKLTLAKGLYFFKGTTNVVVPNVDTLRTDIIRENHNPPVSGHVGQIRTAELIRRSFQWHGLIKDVDAFVGSCHQCQTNKASNQKSGGTLQPVEIPENNWECVSMDLITGLPETKRGNDAITVYVDKLSKMCHLAACVKASSAEETAELFMHEVQSLHGMPHGAPLLPGLNIYIYI